MHKKVFGHQVMFSGGDVYPIHFSYEMEDGMQTLFEGEPHWKDLLVAKEY